MTDGEEMYIEILKALEEEENQVDTFEEDLSGMEWLKPGEQYLKIKRG